MNPKKTFEFFENESKRIEEFMERSIMDTINCSIIGNDIFNLSQSCSHFVDCEKTVLRLKSRLESLEKGNIYFNTLTDALSQEIPSQRVQRFCFISDIKTQFNSYLQYFDNQTKEYLAKYINALDIPYISPQEDKLKELQDKIDEQKRIEYSYSNKITDNHRKREQLNYKIQKLDEEIVRINEEKKLLKESISKYLKEQDEYPKIKYESKLLSITIKMEIDALKNGFESLDEVEEIVKDFFKKLESDKYESGKGKLQFKYHNKYIPHSRNPCNLYFNTECLMPLNDILIKCFNILLITYTFERIERVIKKELTHRDYDGTIKTNAFLKYENKDTKY